VFRDDQDRQEYLDRLIRCRERLGLRILAYCLMGNHLHLAADSPFVEARKPEFLDSHRTISGEPSSSAFS
jgi:hypothetical protein